MPTRRACARARPRPALARLPRHLDRRLRFPARSRRTHCRRHGPQAAGRAPEIDRVVFACFGRSSRDHHERACESSEFRQPTLKRFTPAAKSRGSRALRTCSRGEIDTPDAIPPRSRRGCGRICSRRTVPPRGGICDGGRGPSRGAWGQEAPGMGQVDAGSATAALDWVVAHAPTLFVGVLLVLGFRLPLTSRPAKRVFTAVEETMLSNWRPGAARRHRPRALGRLGLHHLGRHAPLHRRCRALGHDHVRHPRRDADHRLAHRRELRDRHEPADCAKPARLDGLSWVDRRSPAASSASCSSSCSPSCFCRAPVQGGWDAHPGCVGVGWIRWTSC